MSFISKINPTASACIADGIATNGMGPMIITILVSLLLIVCHFIYYNRNKFSLFNRVMSDEKQAQAKQVQAKQVQAKQVQAKQVQAKQVQAPAKPLKIVVFDLDETLGCFIEVGIFWDALEDYYGHNLFKDKFFEVLDILEKEFEPTLVVIPDAIAIGAECYGIYQKVLAHCAKMQSRFAILDVVKQEPTDETAVVINDFREAIGINFLNYGAAYYPWLNTSIVQNDEIDFENVDGDLSSILPEADAKSIYEKYNSDSAKLEAGSADHLTAKKHLHQGLKAVSPTYANILTEIRNKLNQLPPSGAMAGVYTQVDNSRGVWKAPANVSVNMVNAPAINISSEGQQSLNVDVMAGKSINVIRSFPGIGCLVWGGRTLDGNSQDWRYINVRRTLIMIEQSIKLAARAYVFEPNDANTWVTVKSMIENFLINLWKQGALAGAAPEVAFDVQIGLGSTMTPTDILDGKMLITVKVALVRPAEFIVITFQQQMQQS